jgi:hypothetical protein
MTRHLQRFVIATVLVLLAAGFPSPALAQPKLTKVELISGVLSPRVPLAESPKAVVQFTLVVSVDDKGEGPGTLILNPNTPSFTEMGDAAVTGKLRVVEVPCSLKFVKKGKVRAGPPGLEEDWLLFEITSKKIKSRLFLAAPTKEFRHGRLLIQFKGGEVAYAIPMREPDRQPCHPGCFPAGTPIQTPGGARMIESIKAGDVVTGVRPDGAAAPRKVQSVFVTRTRLVKVETEGGALLTTPTQPLCLASGQTRPAGELKAGDRILRWRDGKVEAVKVLSAALTDREEKVFNLVLGEGELFVAGGFLARGKPPPDAAPGGGSRTISATAPQAPPAGPALPTCRR